ncbi:MAG: hypothetical protein GY898_13280 [Proteobacteria bacterium]|nr:hypothetical protein [Pseudomonadota bacterium]
MKKRQSGDWRYEAGGPKLSPHIRRQLQKRRERMFDAWRRDPMREVALLVIGLAVLAAVFVGGQSAREYFFDLSGTPDDATYWMESAQRYRYVEMVADGGWIPANDPVMQAPDGYVPWSDTVLQEVLYGTLYYQFADPEEDDLAAYVRRTTRFVSASAVIPVALLCFGVTRRRDAALLGALVWAVALPMAERGTGIVLFREDLAVPALLWHLAFLAFWVRSHKWQPALLSGLSLALALLLWKVVSFYVLLLVAFLGTAHWLGRAPARTLGVGTALLFAPVAGACFLPLSLRYDSFLTSTAMLAAVAVGAAMGADVAARLKSDKAGEEPKKPWKFAPVAVVAFVVLRLVLPGEAGYSHAWDTILAKLTHLGVKPSDPMELSFGARHYWTGNYESPTLALLVRNWPFLVVTAVPGLLWAGWWWTPKFLAGFRLEDQVPPKPPTKLLEGFGPAEPLLGLASHFVLWLLFGFGGVYLLFRKFQLLVAIPLVVLIALGFAAPKRRRIPIRAAVLVGVVLIAAQGRHLTPDFAQVFQPRPHEQAQAWSPVAVWTGRMFDEFARALPDVVPPEEPVLASFIISPFVLTYSDRPTVLHCFFEGDVLERYERITHARFGSEEELWQVARSYGAKWYVHEAHHLLRTDGRMSQRYVAGVMDWPHDSAMARMQFAPERLKHFELAWENDAFRIYRVLDEGERRRGIRPDSKHALWNKRLFTALFGDPLSPEQMTSSSMLSPSDFLYSTLWAHRAIERARFDPKNGAVGTPQTERELQEAQRVAPYLWGASDALTEFYRLRDRHDRAATHRQKAALARGAMTGMRAVSEDLAPAPVVLLP